MSAVILRIVLFLLPLILYLVWRRQARRRAEAAAEGDQATLDSLQNQFLWIVAGFALVFGAVAVTLALTDGAEPGKEYVPPRMEDGKVVPGEFR